MNTPQGDDFDALFQLDLKREIGGGKASCKLFMSDPSIQTGLKMVGDVVKEREEKRQRVAQKIGELKASVSELAMNTVLGNENITFQAYDEAFARVFFRAAQPTIGAGITSARQKASGSTTDSPDDFGTRLKEALSINPTENTSDRDVWNGFPERYKETVSDFGTRLEEGLRFRGTNSSF